MQLFKTAGETFDGVIKCQKHAYVGKPKAEIGELVLVSKNETDCGKFEKQIQYTMKISGFRQIDNEKIRDEVAKYWGEENRYRWDCMVDCELARKLNKPFDLKDVIGKERACKYGPSVHQKLELEDERKIIDFLKKNGDLN